MVGQATDGVGRRGRVARREGPADGGEPGLEPVAQDGAGGHGLLRAELAGQGGCPVEHDAGGAACLAGLVGLGAGAVSDGQQRGDVLLGGPAEDGHQGVELVAGGGGLVTEVAFGAAPGAVRLGGRFGVLPQCRADEAEGGGVRAAFGVDEGEQGAAGEARLVLLAEEGGQPGAFGAAQSEEPFGGAGPGRPVQQGLGVEAVVAGVAPAALGVVAAQAQAALGERGEGVLAGQPAAGHGRPAAGRSGVEQGFGGPVDVLESGVRLPGTERLADDVPAVDRVDAQFVDAGEDRRVQFVLLAVGEDDQDGGAGAAARQVVEDEFVDGERGGRHRHARRAALAPDGCGGAVPLGCGPQQHDPSALLLLSGQGGFEARLGGQVLGDGRRVQTDRARSHGGGVRHSMTCQVISMVAFGLRAARSASSAWRSSTARDTVVLRRPDFRAVPPFPEEGGVSGWV